MSMNGKAAPSVCGRESLWEKVALGMGLLLMSVIVAVFIWRPEGASGSDRHVSAVAQTQPTQSPASAALTRVFAVDRVYWQEDGSLMVCWSDTAERGPYELRATLRRTDSWRDDMQNGYVIAVTDLQETQGALPDLAPGVDYWLILTDSRGETASVRFVADELVPFDAPTNFSFRISALKTRPAGKDERVVRTFSARGIAGEDSDPGLAMGIYFARTDAPVDYHMRVVIEDPKGNLRVVYNRPDQETGHLGCEWTFFALRGYFDAMLERFGEVWTGDYTVYMYLDNSEAGRASFRVTEAGDPDEYTPPFEAFGVDLKLTLNIQRPSAQGQEATPSYQGSTIISRLEEGWSYPYTLYTDLQLHGVYNGHGEVIVTDPRGGRSKLIASAVSYAVGAQSGDVSRYYWPDCTFDEYFHWLDGAYGEIPTGEYLISYYIDGAHADDVTFFIR